MKKSFKAFTLVEMLIVMGIIIILMAVGITAGRYAINRANDVAHQNAVDNIYTALQAYYADNREYPEGGTGAEVESFGDMTGTVLADYMDDGAFDGGTEATFYYEVDDLQQEVLVCVSLFGTVGGNSRPGSFYCNGNGFGSTNLLGGNITEKTIDRGVDLDESPAGQTFDVTTDWDGSDWPA